MDEHIQQAVGLFALHRMQGIHGEGELIGGPLLHQEHHGGDDDGNHRGGAGKAVVAAGGLREEGVVDLHREGAVALTDQQRGAEVGKGAHEHQQHGGQDGGHAQRHDHGQKTLDALAAHAFSGFQQGIVDVLHGT